MLEMLGALFRHEAWADAEQWRALAAHPSVLANPDMLDRLNHINMVQRGYLMVVRNQPVDLAELRKPIQDLGALQQSFRRYHRSIADFLKGLSPEALHAKLKVDWAPTFQPTTQEALLQMVMHSQHHRGQNALRLRELGGTPPMTDFLIWVGKGYPQPAWD
jgi:uncharacterized damage-inducible protein DinB